MGRKSAIGMLATLVLTAAGSAQAGDPAPSWTFKATYVVHVAFGTCFYSGHCSGGAIGYTCSSKRYCCPASLTTDPPVSTIWEATVENNCTPEDDEFPDLGILITPGVGPDPERHTMFGTAPLR